MSQLLVRQVDKSVVEALKKRAAEHHRSVEAEHRAILEEVLKPKHNTFIEQAAALRAESVGWFSTDAAELIRMDRNSR